MPQRYVRNEDGTWACPPGEQVATPLGFYYRVRSSREIQWVFQRNSRFLSSYWRADAPSVSAQARDEVVALVASHPGITVHMLFNRLETATSDDVYRLCATEQLDVDLYAAPLAEPERVPVFCDQQTANAWAPALRHEAYIEGESPQTVSIEPGAPIVWDGKPCTIVYQGQTTITLLTQDRRPLELTHAHFQALVCSGKVLGQFSSSTEHDHLRTQVRQRLLQASPGDLAEAHQRYAIIDPALHGHQFQETTTPARTIRFWLARYREAAQQLGCGYIGLLPRVHQSGNRRPRLPEDGVVALNEFIEHDYETPKQKRKAEVYGKLVNSCRSKGLVPLPSYKTFIAAVNRRPRDLQTHKRAGARAASPHEPMHWELTLTLPRHGDRPFELAHIDHPCLDIELADSRVGKPLGKPWAPLLTDAFSRRLLAVYLTLDEPSSRSCMMVLRECVPRHNRLPEMLVVDFGPAFRSSSFETFLARYECSTATRPQARPRFGSVVERLFGTANTTFVYNLAGKTQVLKNVRQVTKSVDPRAPATWTLSTL